MSCRCNTKSMSALDSSRLNGKASEEALLDAVDDVCPFIGAEIFDEDDDAIC